MKTYKDLLESGMYLPPVIRDFHDQKDLFKAIFVQYPSRLNKNDQYLGEINWTSAHVFTIDIFLWFMAIHGYTLQKARHKVEFYDLNNTIKHNLKEWNRPFDDMMKEIMQNKEEKGTPND